jgi:DNA-binding GntR family transcriptional regulator
LRKEIVSGALRPGMRIVEATWGRKFGVAQGSIREAINILAQEGFVSKASGRSARTVSLSEEDVLQLYELRGAIEGLAARLAAQRKPDTTNLEHAIDTMRHAAKKDRCENLLEGNREFHLELCRLSGNSYLLEHAQKILLPFLRLCGSGSLRADKVRQRGTATSKRISGSSIFCARGGRRRRAICPEGNDALCGNCLRELGEEAFSIEAFEAMRAVSVTHCITGGRDRLL